MLKKHGKKAIESFEMEVQDFIDKQFNKPELDRVSNQFEDYILSIVGNKMRVVNIHDPMIVNYDLQTAEQYFRYLTYDVTEIDEIFENDKGELAFRSKIAKKSSFSQWVKSYGRPYDGIEMDPSRESGAFENELGFFKYNVFNGWNIKASNNGSCDKFLNFLLHDICNGNGDAYDYLLDWAANIIQYPQKRNPKIIVIRGKQGTGKTTFADVLTKLLGKQYSVTVSNHQLTSNFNNFLFGKFIAIADEAIWSGDRSMWGRLKALTGNSTIQIEGKGKDSFTAENRINIIITTNEGFSNPSEEGDRRYVQFTTSNLHRNDTSYFKALHNELNNGGYEALMYLLQNRKITADFYGDIPKFDLEAYRETRMESLSSENLVAKWFLESFEGTINKSYSVLFHPESPSQPMQDGSVIKANILYNRFGDWRLSSNEPKNVTATTFYIKLKQLMDSKRESDGVYYVFNKKDMYERLNRILGFEVNACDLSNYVRDKKDRFEITDDDDEEIIRGITDTDYKFRNY